METARDFKETVSVQRTRTFEFVSSASYNLDRKSNSIVEGRGSTGSSGAVSGSNLNHRAHFPDPLS